MYSADDGRICVTQICPGLFLGGEESALDVRLHQKLSLALVVNCSNHIPFSKSANGRICHYVKVPVEDNLRVKEVNKMAKLLPSTIAKIHDTLADGKSVLVHCRLGRQRSAAVVAAYLMYRDGMTPENAMQMVKELQPDAFQPFPNFSSALVEYHTHLRVNNTAIQILPTA